MTALVETTSDVATLKKTARLAGLSYLGLAISGVLGFLVVRSQLYVADDAAETAANLVDKEGLARLGIVLELAIVWTQALAALYFYKLFRGVDSFAAGSLAAFGLMNSAVLLTSVAFTATALDAALDGGAETAQLLYDLSESAWGVGAIFFGLWLLPMGWLVRRSNYMPAMLGWLLLVSGVGYILSAHIAFLLPDATTLADVLTFPATVGEFWMIGYLLWKGVGGPAAERR
ncbi:MAG: DUF4386 domain-containing protein [Acidimicrobiia bacterium]|nr:DUF4386 domain-containing protein [Acidimicrobiia bacterium]